MTSPTSFFPSWPGLSPFTRAFFELSYPTTPPANPDSFPTSRYYETGLLDACFLVSAISVFAVLRDIVRLHIATPMANKWLFGSTKGAVALTDSKKGEKSLANGSGHATNGNGNGNGHYAVRPLSAKNRLRERNVVRFAEQSWSLIYYSLWWPFGVYIHINLPHSPWNLDYLWIGVPHTALPTLVKVYYLTQAAFWIHQVLILHAEEHRKDHYQMLSHHIITIALVYASYVLHSTRVGCLVLVLMDFCDIFLALAKMLKYLEIPVAPDVTFVTFMISWLFTRHILYVWVLKSVWIDLPRLRPNVLDPTKEDYMSSTNYYTFTALLGILQVIMLSWFTAIIKVAVSVVRGKPAEDTRSDDELPDSSDEDEPETKKAR